MIGVRGRSEGSGCEGLLGFRVEGLGLRAYRV